MTKTTQHSSWLALALLSLVISTRVSHYLAGVHLPDASLPAFLLAGALGLGTQVLALLLLAAAGIDALLFALDVSRACVSPAYGLLFVAYLAAWGLGRRVQAASLVRQNAALLVSGLLGFVLTSGGYYLLSGKFPEPSLLGFVERSSLYLPGYLANVGLYGVLGLLVTRALSARAASEPRR